MNIAIRTLQLIAIAIYCINCNSNLLHWMPDRSVIAAIHQIVEIVDSCSELHFYCSKDGAIVSPKIFFGKTKIRQYGY